MKFPSCYLVFSSTFYIVSSKSYPQQQPVDTSGRSQDELEDFVQAYFDIKEEKKSGRSDNKPLQESFGEVIKKLREKSGSPGIATTSVLQTTERVADGEREYPNKKSDSRSPQLMDDDSIEKENSTEKTRKIALSFNEDSQPTTTTTTVKPNPAFTTPSNNRRKFNMASNEMRDRRPPVDLVSEEDLKTLFINAGRGTSVMIPGCDLAHFHIKSRCAGNLLELTLLSRNPLKGHVRLLEGDGELIMEGTNLVVYGVLGPLTPSGNLWKLKPQVFKDELESDCYICDNMNVRVVIQVGESTCGMAVSCQQKGSSRILNMEDKFIKTQDDVGSTPPPLRPAVTSPSPVTKSDPGNSQEGGEPPIQDPGNTAKTTMTLTYSLPDMVGMAVSGIVSLGTKMSLVLSVYSRDVTLDLHVVRCQAKGDDGRGVMLVKDGCSVSKVMSEFREVLTIVQESSFGTHSVRKVSQFAELRAFNFRRTHHNITLICTIKMCGGECTERPPCVTSEINLGRSTRPPIPSFTQEVTLGKVFYAGGLPLNPSADLSNLVLDTEPRNEAPPLKSPEDCITRKSVFILLALVTGAYLGILLMCIYWVRLKASKSIKTQYLEDFESPPRSLYSEYSSPRRRTPQTSPEHTTFTINSEEEYKSPSSYKKNIKA